MPSQLPDGFEFVRWEPDQVARHWDFISQVQPETYFTSQVGDILVRRYRREIDAASKVLDFGCGSGHFLELLRSTGKPLAGFDVSEASLGEVRRRLDGYDEFLGAFSPADLDELEAQYDLAFCLEVVEHLDDEQLDAAMGSLRRLVRTGGTLIVSTPNDEDLSQNWICSPDSGRVFHRWQHVRSFTPTSLSACLERHGFETRSVDALDIAASTWRPRALAMRAALFALRRKPYNILAVATAG